MPALTSCPNCGAGGWSVFAATPGKDRLHEIQCRCKGCGLVFSNPQASPADVASFYEGYFATDSCEHGTPAYEDGRAVAAAAQIAEIKGFVDRGRLLDIGAGTGIFLDVARAAGYEVVGVEASAGAVRTAKERFGLDIVQGLFEDLSFAPESFDVVYAWHVIEHVLDLDAFLSSIHRMLRPGGVLYVGTESYQHLHSRALRASLLSRGKVPQFQTASEHTFVFSPDSLRDCQTRRGFEVVRVVAYDEVGLADRVRGVERIDGPRGMMHRTLRRVAARVDPLLGWGPYLRSVALRPSAGG